MRQYPALFVLLTLTACGEPPPAPHDEHAWKAQTDMLEQARQLEGMIDAGSARQRQQIDQQAR